MVSLQGVASVDTDDSMNDWMGRVDSWVQQMEASARGGTASWRFQGVSLNRLALSMPEKIAFAGYDRLRQRKLDAGWKQMFLDAEHLLGRGSSGSM